MELLITSLIFVVGLAELLSPASEAGVNADAPKTIVDIAIAMLVIIPGAYAAIRAARVNCLQSGMNLALGSALASIGLSIPIISVVAIFLGLLLSPGNSN
jgi:Ca2+:H+ antiporter